MVSDLQTQNFWEALSNNNYYYILNIIYCDGSVLGGCSSGSNGGNVALVLTSGSVGSGFSSHTVALVHISSSVGSTILSLLF
jgi:hypothetical protein